MLPVPDEFAVPGPLAPVAVVCSVTLVPALSELSMVVAAEDVSTGKPHPEVFLRAAELLGCPPASCLAVEDSRPGLAAARAAGMKVLAVAAGTLLPTQGGETG